MKFAVILAVLAALPANAQQSKRVEITDPVLKMKAFSYSIPASWNFDGGVAPGSSCVNAATPYWRASSPDGLSGVKLLPRVDWSWSSRPIPGAPPTPDCLPFTRAIKAREFLTQMLPILQVELAREENEPEANAFQRQMQDLSRQQNPTVWSGDRARVIVKYEINGKPVEEIVAAMVMCHDSPVAYVQPPLHTYACSASIWRTHAPPGNLAAAGAMLNSITGSYTGNPEWSQKWAALMTQAITDRAAMQTAASLARGEQLNQLLESRRKAFDEAQSVRSRQHQDFLAGMQGEADRRNRSFRDQQYAKRQNAEDWCDYALDCVRSSDDREHIGNCRNRETLPR